MSDTPNYFRHDTMEWIHVPAELTNVYFRNSSIAGGRLVQRSWGDITRDLGNEQDGTTYYYHDDVGLVFGQQGRFNGKPKVAISHVTMDRQQLEWVLANLDSFDTRAQEAVRDAVQRAMDGTDFIPVRTSETTGPIWEMWAAEATQGAIQEPWFWRSRGTINTGDMIFTTGTNVTAAPEPFRLTVTENMGAAMGNPRAEVTTPIYGHNDRFPMYATAAPLITVDENVPTGTVWVNQTNNTVHRAAEERPRISGERASRVAFQYIRDIYREEPYVIQVTNREDGFHVMVQVDTLVGVRDIEVRVGFYGEDPEVVRYTERAHDTVGREAVRNPIPNWTTYDLTFNDTTIRTAPMPVQPTIGTILVNNQTMQDIQMFADDDDNDDE